MNKTKTSWGLRIAQRLGIPGLILVVGSVLYLTNQDHDLAPETLQHIVTHGGSSLTPEEQGQKAIENLGSMGMDDIYLEYVDEPLTQKLSSQDCGGNDLIADIIRADYLQRRLYHSTNTKKLKALENHIRENCGQAGQRTMSIRL